LNGASLAIFDTSIYIDNLRSGRFKEEIGATVITGNAVDFTAIRESTNFNLICW